MPMIYYKDDKPLLLLSSSYIYVYIIDVVMQTFLFKVFSYLF